jgi:type II secretory pathway pseudopilin PulG
MTSLTERGLPPFAGKELNGQIRHDELPNQASALMPLCGRSLRNLSLMPLPFAVKLTAVATSVLAVAAIAAAILAGLAFRKQSQVLRAIERQMKDGQLQVASGQLQVASGQLELQRQQLEDQRQANVTRADEQRRCQAAMVTAWFAEEREGTSLWGACIRNASGLPIRDVRTFFHSVDEKGEGGDWDSQALGGPVERIRVVPPGADCFVMVPRNIRGHMGDITESAYVVSIEFVDAAGNHWERDPWGALVSPARD